MSTKKELSPQRTANNNNDTNLSNNNNIKHDEKHDLFVYHNQHDNYFDDDDGNSWNNTPLNWNMQSSNKLMANSQKPIIQLGKSFGAARPQFFVF